MSWNYKGRESESIIATSWHLMNHKDLSFLMSNFVAGFCQDFAKLVIWSLDSYVRYILGGKRWCFARGKVQKNKGRVRKAMDIFHTNRIIICIRWYQLVFCPRKSTRKKGRTRKAWSLSSPIRAQDGSWMKPADYRNRGSEQLAFSKRSKVIEVFCDYPHFQNDKQLAVNNQLLITCFW